MRSMTCLLAVIAFPAIAAKPCAVPWSTLNSEATALGLGTTFVRVEGVGSCFRHRATFVASASDSSAVTCQLSFLVGATIKPGWTVTVVGDLGVFEKAPPIISDLNPAVLTKAPQGRSELFRPARFEFTGPADCVTWSNAIATK